jgi:hypothetical protein
VILWNHNNNQYGCAPVAAVQTNTSRIIVENTAMS